MKPEEQESTEVSIETADGWLLKASKFEPSNNASAKSLILILPAMGSHSRPYRFLASSLAANDHIAVTLDLRGHGRSLPHPKRGIDYGYDDFLGQDLPAILKFMQMDHPDLPVFLIGHSFGGHLSAAFSAENPDAIHGIITLTSPHLHFKKLAYPSIIMMALFVVLARTFGYLPGQHIGWGSPIARQQTLDWARWGIGGTFRGTNGRNFEPLLERLTTQNLCIGFTDDKRLARPSSVQHFADLLPNDKTTVWNLSPEDLDTHALGHFDHLRNGAKLWTKLDQWIGAQI